MPSIRHDLVKEVLVVDFGTVGVDLVAERRVLLEHTLARIHVFDDLLGGEDGTGPFAYFKLEVGSGYAHR